ncbi:hypothetical protein SCH01S_48_00870 [Sphingomonas changbaiensis NBRC 104936]|uniref:YCII-related domain-containing protein n=1 Tax=Sphingomonas changbaiensis NBRC 104936 TaxID=1219043 RepID=A0A0E9MSI1_9SPHN|nr:YciI family protein [Sphingomonas changbaiensis]GAO40428.1 hypothetical protein SCH01S_48_00870 [Sphingomonas changbaiensis NBRC 104936]
MNSDAAVRTDAPLCVVVLTYVPDLAAVDARLDQHLAWLGRQYAEGRVLASGRRNPRTGGVIVCRGDRAAVDAIVATDPFIASGVATAEVIPFIASMAAPDLAGLLQ